LPTASPAISAEARLEPSLLEVEITESAYLDRETDQRRRAAARHQGARAWIAIDDFGTGYASSGLPSLAAGRRHQDRPLVRRQHRPSRHDEAIVASTVSLAGTLGKTVIAEGVETAPPARYP
jgi:EAL domain-containing protein (putative c-di-GMP-specific phosphodiesterase class I)